MYLGETHNCPKPTTGFSNISETPPTVTSSISTMTEKDTTLYRKKTRTNARPWIYHSGKKLRPLKHVARERNWDALKQLYGACFDNIKQWLSIRDKCLIIDDRVVILTQMRNLLLDRIHLSHLGTRLLMTYGSPYTGQSSHWVKTAQKVEKRARAARIYKKKASFKLDRVKKPIEEVQLVFGGPMQDKLNKDAYILVAKIWFSKFL